MVHPETEAVAAETAERAKSLNLFERYLTFWVALCMGVGIFLGKAFPGAANTIRFDGIRGG